MRGNQFLALLTLGPLAGIGLVVMAGRFRPVPVIGAAIGAQAVVLTASVLWSQAQLRRALSGHADRMIAFAPSGGANRVAAWLACLAFAALLAGLVLVGHWVWLRFRG